MKKFTLWTNKIDFDSFVEDYKECNGLKPEDSIDENELYEWSYACAEGELSELTYDLSNLEYNHRIIIYGSLGRWNGNFDVHRITTDSSVDALFYSEADYVTWYIENEDFKIEENHHDGNNFFTYRVLTVDPDYFENKVKEKGFDHCIRYYTKKIGKDIVEILGLNI